MRTLVCPHTLEIGGSQILAIDLAESVGQLPGHDVAIYAPDGLLSDAIRGKGIELIIAPKRRFAPSPTSSARLNRIVASRGFDLLHPYEWNTTLDAMFGPGWIRGTPVLSSIMSMDVPYFIPRSVPMIVGTREMQRDALRWRPDVHLIEPPIDTRANAPDATGGAITVRRDWGIGRTELLIVVIGRLAAQLKLEGLLTAIEACTRLAQHHDIRLMIVGDGPARSRVEAAAGTANSRAGRTIVDLVGEHADPRPFYDAADITIGMGASALRALAFAKPLLVQGEHGFWETLSAETLPIFTNQGWYGVGDDTDPVGRCESQLRVLIEATPEARAKLGLLGRRVVEESYSLTAAAKTLGDLYHRVAARRTPTVNRLAALTQGTLTLAKHHAAIEMRKRSPRFRKGGGTA